MWALSVREQHSVPGKALPWFCLSLPFSELLSNSVMLIKATLGLTLKCESWGSLGDWFYLANLERACARRMCAFVLLWQRLLLWEAMQIESIYPFFAFICFLKGHHLHSGCLLKLLSEQYKKTNRLGIGAGRGGILNSRIRLWVDFSNAILFHSFGAEAPQLFPPRLNAWKAVDYCPLRRLHRR